MEPGTLSFTTGTAGQSGTGMNASATVSGGIVTAITITDQGQNAKVGDVLIADAVDLGDTTGSGFQYTLNSNNTGIATVSNISLSGSNYIIGEVLSVDDANVGGGGGSGFQYTISNVGFVSSVAVQEAGQAYELADTLILGLVGGEGIAQGTGFTATLATINPIKALELTQAGDLNMGVGGGSQMSLKPEGSITATSWSINSSGIAQLSSVTTSGNISAAGTLAVTTTSGFTGRATFNGGITVSGADSSIDRVNIKILDGSATQPSLGFNDTSSSQTGLFRQAANTIGVTFAGTEGIRLNGTNYIDSVGLQVDSSLGNANPFLKVETTTPKL